MKYQFDNKQRHWAITAFLVIAASLLVYFAIFHTKSIIAGIKTILQILAPIIYGVAIAYLLSPVLNFLEQKLIYPVMDHYQVKLQKRGRSIVRWICVIFSVILFLVLIYAMVMMVLPQFIRSIINVIQSTPHYAEIVEDWISRFMKRSGSNLSPEAQDLMDQYYTQMQDYLTNNALPQLRSMWDSVSGSIVEVFVFLKNFLIGAIISIYILADKEKFVAKSKMIAYALFSGTRADFMIRAMRFTHATFSGFISGKIIDSAIIGVLCYIGLTFLKMPYALLISVIIGVTNVIPFFGPFIGAIPSFFLFLLVDPIKGLYFLIFILILQQFDGNILGPMILGGSTGLSSFMVIVAIMVGGGLFGPPGMILGVPAFAVLTTGFWKLIHRELSKKQMPLDEEAYINISKIDLVTKEPIPLPIPVRTAREPEAERKNLFMTFWNALMKVVKPVWKFILFILDRAAHYASVAVRAVRGFFQKYWPVFAHAAGKFFKYIGKKIHSFLLWAKAKITGKKNTKTR